MAATTAARRLTEAHRIAQAQVGARVAAQLLTSWRLLDPADLDRTLDAWLSVSVPLIRSGRRTSARLAANYLTTFRSLELGVTSRFTPSLAEEILDEQIITSLLVTGPVSIRSGLGRRPLAALVESARVKTAGAGMRHAMNGGRDTITQTVASDSKALGWARATSGKACAFCAMLASRGPVYSQTTVDFDAHDHCSCTAEPVYRRDAAWPAGADRYRDLWNEATAGHSGQDAVNVFRRALAA